MVDGVAHAIRDSLGPLLELFPVTCITGNVTLIHAIGTQGTPFVMIATQPQFGYGAETMVLGHLAGIEVAMIVDNGQMFGRLVIKFLRGFSLQQKILVHECFHNYTILHGKYIETTIYHRNRTRYKGRCITDEIMYGSAQFLGFAETLEGSLTYYIGATFSKTAVGIR